MPQFVIQVAVEADTAKAAIEQLGTAGDNVISVNPRPQPPQGAQTSSQFSRTVTQPTPK